MLYFINFRMHRRRLSDNILHPKPSVQSFQHAHRPGRSRPRPMIARRITRILRHQVVRSFEPNRVGRPAVGQDRRDLNNLLLVRKPRGAPQSMAAKRGPFHRHWSSVAENDSWGCFSSALVAARRVSRCTHTVSMCNRCGSRRIVPMRALQRRTCFIHVIVSIFSARTCVHAGGVIETHGPCACHPVNHPLYIIKRVS